MIGAYMGHMDMNCRDKHHFIYIGVGVRVRVSMYVCVCVYQGSILIKSDISISIA